MKNNVAKVTEYGDLVIEVNHTKTNDTSDVVKKVDHDTKIDETEKEILNHNATLKQANLASKNDIADFGIF